MASWGNASERMDGEKRMIHAEGEQMSVEDRADLISEGRVLEILSSSKGLKEAIERAGYPVSMHDAGPTITQIGEKFGIGDEDVIAAALHLQSIH
jgi:hypothetical protein